MTPPSLAQIEAGLQALAGIDFANALASFQAANLQGELQTMEQLAAFAEVFFPPTVYIEDGLVLLSFVVAAKQAGLWAPASPDDPAMIHAQGHQGLGQDRT